MTMWFQTPQYLRWSRLQLLRPENRQSMLEKMGIRPGDRVLDVGCGSGALTIYLAEGVQAQFVGIDLDASLIEAALAENCPNADFLCADALALPFADGSFDAVISHTFFTAVFQAETAMAEMRRVCKKGGIIASITADSTRILPCYPGDDSRFPWAAEFRRLRTKMDLAFRKEATRSCPGVLPEAMPRFFAQQGLREITVHPFEKFISLSNMTASQRQTWLEAEYASDLSRLELLPAEDRQSYVRLLEMRKADLLTPENHVWAWSGGCNLLILAKNPGPAAENIPAPWCPPAQAGELTLIRAHVGSFSSAVLRCPEGEMLFGCGETPEAALQAVFEKQLAHRYACLEGLTADIRDPRMDTPLLRQSLQQLDPQIADSSEALTQALAQWDSCPTCYEYTGLSAGDTARLPQWLLRWCYTENACRLGRTPAEARLNSLLTLCADAAQKLLLTHSLTPPAFSHSLWEAVPEVRRAAAILEQYGIRLRFLDASCGMDLPVIGILASGNGGVKLRTCAGRTLREALLGCMASVLEGCTPENFFAVSGQFTRKPLTHTQLYNALTTGEGCLPAALLSDAPGWQPRNWEVPAATAEEAANALQSRLLSLGWQLYSRTLSRDGLHLCHVIVPGVGMLLDFGSQRLVEYRLRQIAVPVLRNFSQTTSEQQTLAMKYLTMKQGCLRQNGFAYLAGTQAAPQLFDTPIDARLLLALCHIRRQEYAAARALLPDSTAAFRCLKALLEGEDPGTLAALYSAEAVNAAVQILQRPLAAISFCPKGDPL